MTAKTYKRFFRSTALTSLSLVVVSGASAEETASIQIFNPAAEIRAYYGDPEDTTYGKGLTDMATIGGITADGSAFVGTVYRSYAKSIQSGFIWDAANGTRPSADRPASSPLVQGQSYTSTDISEDGSVIVGKASGDLFGTGGAYRWTEAGGFQALGTLNDGFTSLATAVSGDGKVVVGYSGGLNNGEGFRWTADNGMQSLGFLPGGDTIKADQPLSANYDGSVVVGMAMTAGNLQNGFRWTEATGIEALPSLENKLTVATDISWDGSIIAGYSQKGYAAQAVRWVNGEIGSLGGLDGAPSVLSWAQGISGNGQVIVGNVSYNGEHGFRWSEDTGMVTVEDWLRASGAEVPANFPGQSIITETADATNEDGSVVVGRTRDDEVYIARGNGTGPSGNLPGGGTGGGTTGGGSTGGGSTGGGSTGGNSGGGTAGGGTTGNGGTGGGTGGNTGGNTGGGGTGGNTGGGTAGGGSGAGGGAGLITVTSLAASLGTTATAATATLNSLGIITNGAGSRPLDRRAPAGKSITWASGDWGSDDHGSRDGTLGLGEFGFGHNFGPIQLNGIVGYTGLNQNTMFGGSTDVNAGYVKLEAMGLLAGDEVSGLWGVVTGVGLWGEADITRNYVTNGGLIDSSVGNTGTEGYGIRGRLEWENALPYLSPYGEVSFASNCLNGYTETGGAFPASFDRLCDDTTELRYGFDTTIPVSEKVNLIGTLEGVHRFQSHGSNVSGQVLGLGGFNFAGASYQQDWLRAGAGFEVDIAGSTLSIMGNVTTRGESANAWVAANWRVTF
ncbi:hypothetical protein [Martelella limonii]|uniref:hypothetical protein n=1 Tax=Martelella limonii TaxID=1647649 RepID=UPI0015812988|nr:hypothetical protein [Martelella limonii]